MLSSKRVEIGGRPATMVGLSEKFEPVDVDSAPLVKLIFDDGEVAFASPVKEKETEQ